MPAPESDITWEIDELTPRYMLQFAFLLLKMCILPFKSSASEMATVRKDLKNGLNDRRPFSHIPKMNKLLFLCLARFALFTGCKTGSAQTARASGFICIFLHGAWGGWRLR
jgi:hypothetical protein